jgi:hypothetical protein
MIATAIDEYVTCRVTASPRDGAALLIFIVFRKMISDQLRVTMLLLLLLLRVTSLQAGCGGALSAVPVLLLLPLSATSIGRAASLPTTLLANVRVNEDT